MGKSLEEQLDGCRVDAIDAELTMIDAMTVQQHTALDHVADHLRAPLIKERATLAALPVDDEG